MYYLLLHMKKSLCRNKKKKKIVECMRKKCLKVFSAVALYKRRQGVRK